MRHRALCGLPEPSGQLKAAWKAGRCAGMGIYTPGRAMAPAVEHRSYRYQQAALEASKYFFD